jgi:hypothetical protein
MIKQDHLSVTGSLEIQRNVIYSQDGEKDVFKPDRT